jgi:hypothetical protein
MSIEILTKAVFNGVLPSGALYEVPDAVLAKIRTFALFALSVSVVVDLAVLQYSSMNTGMLLSTDSGLSALLVMLVLLVGVLVPVASLLALLGVSIERSNRTETLIMITTMVGIDEGCLHAKLDKLIQRELSGAYDVCLILSQVSSNQLYELYMKHFRASYVASQQRAVALVQCYANQEGFNSGARMVARYEKTPTGRLLRLGSEQPHALSIGVSQPAGSLKPESVGAMVGEPSSG